MHRLTRTIVALNVFLAFAAALRAADDKPDAAVVWRHKPGNSDPGEITLHANGKINNPDGQDSWTFTGKTLELRWASPKAPGGFWTDTCTVSDDGETYSGVNQRDMPIVGWKVNRPAVAALGAADIRAAMKQRPNDNVAP